MIRVERYGPVTKFRLARRIVWRPAYWTTAYLVDGLLVDTGCHFTAAELLAALKGEKVETIVNTHSHEDHIGANAEISGERGAAIYAHALALPVLENPRLNQMQFYRRVFWGWPMPSRGRQAPVEVGTEQYRFQVLGTPGHSQDHIALYEPQEGWLFTGDLFIGGRERTLRPDYDVVAALQSLGKIAELPVSRLFPGSGSVRDHPGQEIRDKIAYMQGLREEIRKRHGQGWSDREIARRLLGRNGSIYYLTGGHFSTMNLVRAYLRDQ